jgi:hypothetical protein
MAFSLKKPFPFAPRGRSVECGVIGTIPQVRRCSVPLVRTSHASLHPPALARGFTEGSLLLRLSCLVLASHFTSRQLLTSWARASFFSLEKNKSKVFHHSALVQSARCPCCARLRARSDRKLTGSRPHASGFFCLASLGLAAARGSDRRFV